MRADNSRHVIAAAQRRAEQTRQRAVAALRRMDAAGQRISFNSVSRTGRGVRSWLYAQGGPARGDRTTPRPGSGHCHRRRSLPSGNGHRIPRCCAASEAATARIRRVEADNLQLRDALARALGERRSSRSARTGEPAATHRRSTPPKLIGPR